MNRDVRLLTFTSLYPSAAWPRHGIFVESRLRRLIDRGGISARVVAPVPWFPFHGKRWGRFGRMAATPLSEKRYGIEVRHPRYFVVPKIGMSLQPGAMVRSALGVVRQMADEGDFDLIDAHYLYPDGVAAAQVAAELGRPYVLSARGTDVNVIAQMTGPQRRILRAIEGSAAVIAVSAALKAALVLLGVDAERVTVLRNGVDSDLFHPEDRVAARATLGLPTDGARIAMSIGNLVQDKRHDLLLGAAAKIHGLYVVIVGSGPKHAALNELARHLGIAERVIFLDEMAQENLRIAYAAADVLVLPSQREGWPNVLLESAACGTPVIAFDVGGVREIIAERSLGIIIGEVPAVGPLVNAIQALLADPPAREAVRAAAKRFSWDPVLDAQLSLYRSAIG